MASVGLGENLGVSEELIKKACSIAVKAHKSPDKQYLSKKISSSLEVVFSFPGTWILNDWYKGSPFGEAQVDLLLFPSLKYIGLNEIAKVNDAFQLWFKALLDNSGFKREVGRAVLDRKQVVFTGHSSGGPIAILATVWFLEEYVKPNPIQTPPLCLTFGSPLVGDHIMNRALRRENWTRYFVHFVMRYDIVPRLSLTPLSAIQKQLQQILSFLNPKSPLYARELVGEAPIFYINVMRNASIIASHSACKIMGNTNLLLETMSNFIELSPYRPIGTYVFCTGEGKFVIIRNPDAVLQILFYSSKLNSQAEGDEVSQRCLRDHLNYENELQESLNMQSTTYLDHLDVLPLSSDVANPEAASINMVLNDLGLCERARLCLRAAEELVKQKLKNKETIDKKKEEIIKKLDNLEAYKSKCAHLSLGYYDAFKISQNKEDFDANVNRLELAGIWDEIIEMLKRYELPDEFEGEKAWIELGTRYRRIVEPLDIANYYRHSKDGDTGPYMGKGRPKRYKCTQRWREYAETLQNESLESCFWAEVEELCTKTGSPGVKDRILILKDKAQKWIQGGVLDKDVFLERSTFTKLCGANNVDQDVQFQT